MNNTTNNANAINFRTGEDVERWVRACVRYFLADEHGEREYESEIITACELARQAAYVGDYGIALDKLLRAAELHYGPLTIEFARFCEVMGQRVPGRDHRPVFGVAFTPAHPEGIAL